MTWIPVSKQLPADGRAVLVWSAACDAAGVGWYGWGVWRDDTRESLEIPDVTHWMPLPLGPDVRGETES